MSRLTRAAVCAALAAAALPAAAQASVVEETGNGSLRLRGGSEANIVSVSSSGNSVRVQDLARVQTRTNLCSQISDRAVQCAIGVRLTEAQLGSGNDLIAVAVSNRVVVDGGFGNDGLDGGKTAGTSAVTFRGGPGTDFASYSTTDRAVRVSPGSFDGRPGLDQDIISSDVERIVGSRFGDELTSISSFGTLSGGPGDDVLIGSTVTGAITTFDMGRRADGADRIVPGSNVSAVDYSGRTQPVNATIGFNGRDDGEAGERDEILLGTGNVHVFGGSAADTMRVLSTAQRGHGLRGNGGNDTLHGAGGPDFLEGGAGADTLLANGGDDVLSANDGVSDIVGCGAGNDIATLDSRDGHSGCERRTVVGKLALAPAAIAAKAGKPARLRLSWRHPRDWRKLRSVELRLLRDGVPVGAVTVRPRRERIGADGLIELVRRGTRLRREGKAVTARLALRLDERLAGSRLALEVEATDTRGRRQLETDAAAIRVAR